MSETLLQQILDELRTANDHLAAIRAATVSLDTEGVTIHNPEGEALSVWVTNGSDGFNNGELIDTLEAIQQATVDLSDKGVVVHNADYGPLDVNIVR